MVLRTESGGYRIDWTKRQEPPRFDSPPLDERKQALHEAQMRNEDAGKPPYSGVRLHNLGEVLWISTENGWHLRQGRHNLTNFRPAQLSGVDMSAINLSGIDMWNADLSNAVLGGAVLRDSRLFAANLSGAVLTMADLRGAVLRYADLRGTKLPCAALNGANLQGVRMDVNTDLRYIELDSGAKLAYIIWNGVPLNEVDWEQVPRIGDEPLASGRWLNHEQRRQLGLDYRAAAQAYTSLSIALRDERLTGSAARYRFRGSMMLRKAYFWHGKWGRYALSTILNLTSGYGEKLWRAFASYAVTIGGFTAAYYIVTNHLKTHSYKLTWDEALVVSVSAFHGRGFLPSYSQGTLSLGDPVARVAMAEAFIGLLIEVVLIATFSRRFFNE